MQIINMPPSKLEIRDNVMFKLHPWDTVFQFGKIVDKRYDGSSREYKIKYTKYEVVQISDYVKEMFATKTK
ncbi:MAG: hypothetical protein UEP31_08520 [Anaerovoracaceae bacterium]|nr:hypothetical protein [Anaerovoracaceae bacterium]